MSDEKEQSTSPQPQELEDTVDVSGTVTLHSDDLALKGGEIMIYISGGQQPIRVSNAEQITFGRGATSLEGQRQFIDLEAFHGGAMGVSRQHAVIHVTEDGIFVEDLQSTNGTSVNEQKISAQFRHLLKSGDRVTLGQLRLTVYFGLKPDVKIISQLHLEGVEAFSTDLEDNHGAIQTTLLVDELAPLIVSITELQQHFNLAKGYSAIPRFLRMSTLANDQKKRFVMVEISDIEQTVDFIQETIQPLRMINIPTVVKVRKPDGGLTLSLPQFAVIVANKQLVAEAEQLLDVVSEKLTERAGIEPSDNIKQAVAAILFSRFDVNLI